jgi:gas vesicle protein
MRIEHSLRTAATWVVMAGLGAAVALLLAPQSGRRTRRQIRLMAQGCWYSLNGELEKAQDLLTRGKDAADYTARELSRKLKLNSKVAWTAGDRG